MTTFITHPSVRIKGTETNYNPVQCLDLYCNNKTPHMHCPFCQKSESYTDPIILRAHYRVKHVDKGIDFAGLKVLRCCDHCDIVGAIKGEKKFKGAHWHCYKCKNGFNRRDEAIKHYKTHFRNPQTTFQIHIAQEVNNPIQYYENQDELQAYAPETANATIHPILTEASVSLVKTAPGSNNENDSSLANGPTAEFDHIHVSIGANETVGPPNDSGQQSIMIINEDNTRQTANGVTEELESQQQNMKAWQLKEELFIEKERRLLDEINELKSQVQKQTAEIQALKKRERDLIQQIDFPSNSKIQDLINNLQNQHSELLQQQMLQVKRAMFFSSNGENGSCDIKNFLPVSQSIAGNVPVDRTLITLVMDQSGNILPLNQPMITQEVGSGIIPMSTVEFSAPSNSDEDTMVTRDESTDHCKSPPDSLVIIDLSDDMKKREADNEDRMSTESKRKK